MKVFLDTVGCRLNQSEIERMALEFRAAGHTIAENLAEAELVVVNTCAVTLRAASDSRQKIRQAARQIPGVPIVATGCWATLEPNQAAELLGTPRVIVNNEKETLTATVLNISPDDLDLEPLERELLPGARHRTRAFIKVQDGCDAFCTFCVTRIARGPSRSVPVDILLKDIHSAILGGAQEIVLSGVQLGSWGKDLSGSPSLRILAQTILNESDTPRLRFSSVEPWDIDEDFFEVFSNERVCRHLHISLQSGSGAILKRMARQITPMKFSGLLAQARVVDPEFAITTDVIAGFPGESEKEFQESLKFIEESAFSGGHVFPYSPRPRTPAAGMPGQIPLNERKKRASIIRQVIQNSSHEYMQRQIGRTVKVLWESVEKVDKPGGGFMVRGLNENFIRVRAKSPWDCWNRINRVKIIEAGIDELIGEIMPG